MACRNPEPERVCLCPAVGHGPRRVLADKFINSWLTDGRRRQANAIAADTAATDEQLWGLLFELEEEVSGCLAMWESTL